MANPAPETVDPPYVAFRFEVVLTIDDPPAGITNPVCAAAFAECDGLEMSMEPKTVQEGGNNGYQAHLIGPVKYAQLTLRRGMTANLQLWNWFVAASQPGRKALAHGKINLWDADGTPRLTFVVEDCLPVKVRGPALNARDGQVAIEEMALAYARLSVQPYGTAAGGGMGIGFSASVGASFSAGAGFSAGASAGAGFSASGSAGLSVSGGPGLSGNLSGNASAGFSLG